MSGRGAAGDGSPSPLTSLAERRDGSFHLGNIIGAARMSLCESAARITVPFAFRRCFRKRNECVNDGHQGRFFSYASLAHVHALNPMMLPQHPLG
jgi:hypothetical protein